MHLEYGMPILLPRLLRAKNGAPGLTPAIGLLTPVCAGAIEPPSAGGGALGVLLPPMKGSLPAGMEPISSQQAQRDYTPKNTRCADKELAEVHLSGYSECGWRCAIRAVARSGIADL